MKWIAVFGVALITISPGHAQQGEQWTIDSILPACEKFVIDPSMRNLSLTEGAEVGVCTGVVGTLWGVRDFLIDKYRFCPPENVTVLDATKVLIAFHTSRSKRPQLDDVRLEALLAFKSKWPCK